MHIISHAIVLGFVSSQADGFCVYHRSEQSVAAQRRGQICSPGPWRLCRTKEHHPDELDDGYAFSGLDPDNLLGTSHDSLPPTTKNPMPSKTHVPTLRLVSDRAGRAVRFPACARAAKLAFLRLISAAVG